MYLVTGYFIFKQEHSKRAEQLMQEMVIIGRQEEGIIRYTFYPVPDEQNGYFLFEEWQSKTLHDDHFNGELMQNILPEFFELLAVEPEVSYFDATLSSKL